ncbi:MAG: M48 family metallopeptidase, partial [Gammaproteobacteria bacterium]|nr:M48 family metallopeptidase [Gammaproteobacteria bacterium]
MHYKLVRSQRKTLSIHVLYPNIEVRAPFNASTREIDCFVRQKSKWLEEKLIAQGIKHDERYEIEDGKEISFLGETKQIRCHKAAKSSVTLNDNTIHIQCPNPEPRKVRTLFESWLKSHAETELTHRTHALIQKLAIEDRLSGIKFRKTKSKWGHCTSQGILQFNWLIVMAPEHVIDYLVTHEV